MGFLFVDRICEMDAGTYVRGIKHITSSDAYLVTGEQGIPCLMASIIGETLGQLGAWSVMYASEFNYRPVAGVVASASIHGEASIGETLALETIIDSWDPQAIQYHAMATVEGRPVFSIDSALGPMLAMNDFNDKRQVEEQFNTIYRPGESESFSRGSKQAWMEGEFNCCSLASFDSILAWEPGDYAIAIKHVSLSAPYFIDHFPRKPVLPLTILLNAKLELASHFLSSCVDDAANNFRPIAVRKVKMSGFVQPGDSVKTTVKVKKQTQDEMVFVFKSEVAGKRVCVAEAVFAKRGDY